MTSDTKTKSSVWIGHAGPSDSAGPVRKLWRHTGRRVFDGACTAVRVMRNTAKGWASQPDYKRWSSAQNLQESWDERTRMIAELVPPSSAVIEFGAGRRQLEKFLPAGCTYIPSDLVDRGPGTIVCDLNRRPLPDLSGIAPDVCVFGGVLEYVRDVPDLVNWLARSDLRTCVASFDPMPASLGIRDRYRELVRRAQNGYMNKLTQDELLSIFKAAGFECARKKGWSRQTIFQFRRRQ